VAVPLIAALLNAIMDATRVEQLACVDVHADARDSRG